MPRVAGCDPGTSSLDILALETGAGRDRVLAQVRIEPDELRADPSLPIRWLREHGPFDLIAGPSGYGLPLVRAEGCTDSQLALMALVRPDEPAAKGVGGFSAVARAFRDSGLPVVFLPGAIHLPTVPAHRKLNRVDLGTADKVCVAALALAQHMAGGGSRGNPWGVPPAQGDEPALVAEFGSAFTALLVLKGKQIVDGLGGTCGPLGGMSGGAWDGETAYLLSPLEKRDLFRGGVADIADRDTAVAAFREGFTKAVYGLLNVHGVQDVYYSGSLFRTNPDFAQQALGELPTSFFRLHYAGDLPGAWVKHAAQGAALIAEGLCGGTFAPLVEALKLREARGTALDWLLHPRANEVRAAFA